MDFEIVHFEKHFLGFNSYKNATSGRQVLEYFPFMHGL